MKKETIEEYLARGGVIKRYPSQAVVETPTPIRSTSTTDQNIMSLDEGAHYFAENRKTNKATVKTVTLKDIVDNYGLPKEIADRLRGANAK